MIRRIHCQTCGWKHFAMHPEDVADGWKRRITRLAAKKPENHSVEIYGGDNLEAMRLEKRIALPSINCDNCNSPIKDSEEAVAITMYQGREPKIWETEYGEII
jgi:hypothetical protein